MAEFATACILSFNRLGFLQQMIESMKAHADYPLEIIVHDDGSSDPELREWLRKMIDTGDISTLIENPPGHNQGQGIALNRMFEMAKGDPIIKLDHDLIFRPGWLRQAATVLETNRKVISEPRIGCLGLFKYSAPPVEHTEMHMKDWSGWQQCRDFVGSAMVIPRVAWENFGPFEERSEAFAEDYEFKMKIANTPGWALGLTADDLVVNQGFGVGPSTVAVERDGELTSEKIKPGTHVLGAR